MRGVPDHSPEQPSVPTSDPIPVCAPTVTPKAPLPEALAALGQEVLELVPRKQRGSLDAYRQAATALSATLKMSGVEYQVCGHHRPTQGAPTLQTPGAFSATLTAGGVGDCRLTSLLSLRALSALVALLLMLCLPYMEYAILPENPWQLPVLLNRSPLHGMEVRGADWQLEKPREFPANDS